MIDIDTQHLISGLLGQVDDLLENTIFDGYQAVSAALTLPLTTIAAISIILLGFSIMMGWTPLRMSVFIKTVFKIGLITMAVTDWGWVSEICVQGLNAWVDTLGTAVVQATHTGGDINEALNATFNHFMSGGTTLIRGAGHFNLTGILSGVIVWAAGVLLVGFALIELVIAKVMVAILWVFTPLIVLSCFFKPLQSSFDRWLGALIGFALVQVFVMASVGFSLSLVKQWTEGLLEPTSHGPVGVIPILIVSLIGFSLIKQAASLAQNLGGSVVTLASNTGIGAMVGGYLGAKGGALKESGGKLLQAGAATLGGLAHKALQGSFGSPGGQNAKSQLQSAKQSVQQGGSS